MTPDQLAYLKTHEERLAMVMLRHCLVILSVRYGLSADCMLPRGKSPQDIVFDVLEKYHKEERKFDAKFPIEAQLKRGIQSWLSSLFRSSDGQLESLDESQNAEHASAAKHSDTPDLQMANRHDLDVLFKMLMTSSDVKRSRELQKLVAAIK